LTGNSRYLNDFAEVQLVRPTSPPTHFPIDKVIDRAFAEAHGTYGVPRYLLAALMFFVSFFQNDFAKFQRIARLIKCSAKELGEVLTVGKLGFFDIGLIRL
jgi:hypothetical protein